MPKSELDAAVEASSAPVILIGGATTPNGRALGAFVELAHGREGGRIVALTSASGNPAASARAWHRDFLAAGCHNVEIPIVATRAQARDERVAAALHAADGIFLGGGDQVKLVSIVGGTLAGDAIRDAHARGIVVGGSSAGAAALAKTTLAGNETDEHGQLVEQYIGPGLGLVSHPTIIDTHFSQRRRLYRLFVALAEYPELMGLGVDEDTALVIRGNQGAVCGAGGVTFVDGRDVSYSNAGARRDGTPLTLSAVRVGIVGAGHAFDLAKRELITAEGGIGSHASPAVTRRA
ncbi:MAG TPA: cyanophycinase [Candidatus Elarobacter sp.]|nr:cyanophycinase [Candidatus Elarobacter sp.]